MTIDQTPSVIPDGPQGRSGTQERSHSLNPWVPALRFAAAGMTGLFFAGSVAAQPARPLIHEPAAVAAGFDATMQAALFAAAAVAHTMPPELVDIAVGDSWNMKLPADLAAAARAYDEAQVKGDKATLERLLAWNYLLFNSAGQAQTKTSFIADSTAATWKLSPFKVEQPSYSRVEGDTAFLGGVVMLKGRSAGRPFSSRLRFMDVWAKRDGQWVVVFTQATTVAP